MTILCWLNLPMAEMLFADTLENQRDLLCLTKSVIGFTRPVSNNVCEWHGVECIDGRVQKIRWKNCSIQVCSLSWLPPRTRKILFYGRNGHKNLDTRQLPRELSFCRINLSDVIGEVDLRSLPAVLEVLDLKYNSLCGEIYLLNLPAQMRFIQLQGNPIKSVIVDNNSLPNSIVIISFFNKASPRVKLITCDGSKVDRRIKNDGQYSPSFDDEFNGL